MKHASCNILYINPFSSDQIFNEIWYNMVWMVHYTFWRVIGLNFQIHLYEPVHEIANNVVMCHQQSLRSACAYAQSDQSLC